MTFEHKPEKREAREKVTIRHASQEEAVETVKNFWAAMPHASGLSLPTTDDTEGWTSELTAGDRTKISRGILGADRGMWLVHISGNHQALTPEAEKWLKEKGFVS